MTVAIPVIDYLNLTTKHIYLLAGVREYHPVEDIYVEIRNIRRVNETMRVFDQPVSAEGAVPKGSGKYTPRYSIFKHGWTVVPEDVSHDLYITGEQITDDGQSGKACLDLTVLSPGTNIFVHYEPPAAEIIRDEASLEAIENMSFGGGVHIDIINGISGIAYPSGNEEYPSDNLSEAIAIANSRGFRKLFIRESMIGVNALNNGTILNGFHIIGDSAVTVQVEIDATAICNNLTIKSCDVFGELDGGTHIVDCKVGNLTYVNGHIDHCGLYGNIYLAGNEEAVLSDCYIIDQDFTPIIDMGGSGQDLAMPNYSGIVNIQNLSESTDEIGVGLNAGMVILDSSVTAGTIIIGGVGLLYDYSTGTADVNDSGLVNRIADEYNKKVIIDTASSYTGTTYPTGTLKEPVNNVGDALAIMDRYSLEILHLHSDVTFIAGMDISKKVMEAHKSRSLTITIGSGVITEDAEFSYLEVTGVSGCDVIFNNCLINNLTEMCGSFEDCYFDGNNTCRDDLGNHVHILNSRAWDRIGTTIDVGQAMVTVQGWVSHLILAGKYGTNQVNINSLMSNVTINSDCIEGVINLSGTGYVVDNSSVGCTVLTDKLNNKQMQADTIIDYDLVGYSKHGTFGGIQVKDAYGDTVHVDMYNSTGNATSGTTFPVGLPHHPVDNVPDLLAILDNYHCNRINVNGDLLIPDSTNINGYTFDSGATIDRTITIPITATTNGTKFRNVILTGYLSGRVDIKGCFTNDLNNFRGMISHSTIEGTLDFDDSTGQTSMVIECTASGDGGVPIFVINNSKVTIIDWVGWATISNKISTGVLGISASGGIFTVDPSCSAGTIIFAGLGTESHVGVTGCTIDSSYLLNKEVITKSVMTYDGTW